MHQKASNYMSEKQSQMIRQGVAHSWIISLWKILINTLDLTYRISVSDKFTSFQRITKNLC